MRSNRHSKATDALATRGARTTADGAAATPNRSNSLSSKPNIAEVAFMTSASAADTVFTTNSPVDSMFRRVSLGEPSRWFTGQNSNVGGRAQTPWKKLNGARLATPETETVLTQAMGRGKIEWIIHSYIVRVFSWSGSSSMGHFPSQPSRKCSTRSGRSRL